MARSIWPPWYYQDAIGVQLVYPSVDFNDQEELTPFSWDGKGISNGVGIMSRLAASLLAIGMGWLQTDQKQGYSNGKLYSGNFDVKDPFVAVVLSPTLLRESAG